MRELRPSKRKYTVKTYKKKSQVSPLFSFPRFLIGSHLFNIRTFCTQILLSKICVTTVRRATVMVNTTSDIQKIERDLKNVREYFQ